jgi:hypothetical protein
MRSSRSQRTRRGRPQTPDRPRLAPASVARQLRPGAIGLHAQRRWRPGGTPTLASGPRRGDLAAILVVRRRCASYGLPVRSVADPSVSTTRPRARRPVGSTRSLIRPSRFARRPDLPVQGRLGSCLALRSRERPETAEQGARAKCEARAERVRASRARPRSATCEGRNRATAAPTPRPKRQCRPMRASRSRLLLPRESSGLDLRPRCSSLAGAAAALAETPPSCGKRHSGAVTRLGSHGRAD